MTEAETDEILARLSYMNRRLESFLTAVEKTDAAQQVLAEQHWLLFQRLEQTNLRLNELVKKGG